MVDPREMPFLAHLAELRTRLIRSLFALLIGFGVAYGFSKPLFRILMLPFDDAYQSVFHRTPKLITTGLVESFMVYMKVGLLGGVFLASPVIFLQIWGFISPALKRNEKKHVIPFVLLATIFFCGGAFAGYYGIFPIGFRYFLSIAPGEYIEPMIRMEEYFKLASWMLLTFGLVAEAPMIVLYLAYMGVLGPRHLLKPWRAIIVGIAISSAFFTPPDPGSMMMMMVPMLALYGITIILSFFVSGRKTRSQTSES